MPNSLKTKLSKLRYKCQITNEEYQELIDKLDGHDAEIRADERVRMLEPYDVESIEELIQNVRAKTIEEILQTIRNGMSELLESPWATEKYLCSHDYDVRKTMEIIDDLILKSDIEQMKGDKNERTYVENQMEISD